MEFDEAVPDMGEIERQLRRLRGLLPLLLANGRDVIPQSAAARARDLLRVLELEPPVSDYFFEDASVKFARLAMKAST